MINYKIIEILHNYGLTPSKINEEANLIFFSFFLTIDLGPGIRNNNNLKGVFDFSFRNFSFHGDIDFSSGEAVVSNLTSEPISIADLIDTDFEDYEIPNERIFKLLGFSKAELKLT